MVSHAVHSRGHWRSHRSSRLQLETEHQLQCQQYKENCLQRTTLGVRKAFHGRELTPEPQMRDMARSLR
jgi:hypothetical protein